MVEGWGFCPYCRTPRAAADARMCTGCGRTLPPMPVRDAVREIAPEMASARVRRSVLSSWGEFATILGIVGYTFLAWVVVSIVVGITVGHAADNGVGRELSGLSVTHADVTVIVGQIAMFSSLVAGLGFRTFASGTWTTLSVVPMGSLALLALVARFTARGALRRNPPSSIPDLFVRITLAAGLTSLAIFVLSSISILVYATTATAPGGPIPSATASGAAAPIADAFFFVLFPTIWIGAAAGVFSLAPARVLVGRAIFARAGERGGQVLRFLTPAAIAVRAYVIAVVALSPLIVAGWAAWCIMNEEANTTGIALSLPAVLSMGPNAVLTLALGITGSVVEYGTSELTLWQADPWLILAGILCLLGPAGYAGFAVARRRPDTSPGGVGAAGIAVALTGLILVNIAAPSLKVAGIAATGATQGATAAVAGGITRLVFDLGQAAIVGGAVVLVAVVLGFVAGVFTRPATSDAQAAATVPTITV